MSLGSVVGFASVFVLVCGASSAALALALRATGPRGPAFERCAAALAAALPVALGVGVVAILVLESVVAYDHCGTHAHHAHLCLVHGAEWLHRGWAIALVSTCGAAVAARAGLLAFAVVRGRRLAARLRRVAEREGDVHVVASERAFSFVAGIHRPSIIVSTAARDALDREEWDAMLAHERGHVRHRDLRSRIALDAMLVFAAPLAGIAIRDRWELATERLRDAEAAAEVGSHEAVASALVRIARSASQLARTALPAFTPRHDAALAARIANLLEPAAPGHRAARLLAGLTAGAVLVALAACALLADPLHHALETLLG